MRLPVSLTVLAVLAGCSVTPITATVPALPEAVVVASVDDFSEKAHRAAPVPGGVAKAGPVLSFCLSPSPPTTDVLGKVVESGTQSGSTHVYSAAGTYVSVDAAALAFRFDAGTQACLVNTFVGAWSSATGTMVDDVTVTGLDTSDLATSARQVSGARVTITGKENQYFVDVVSLHQGTLAAVLVATHRSTETFDALALAEKVFGRASPAGQQFL